MTSPMLLGPLWRMIVDDDELVFYFMPADNGRSGVRLAQLFFPGRVTRVRRRDVRYEVTGPVSVDVMTHEGFEGHVRLAFPVDPVEIQRARDGGEVRTTDAPRGLRFEGAGYGMAPVLVTRQQYLSIPTQHGHVARTQTEPPPPPVKLVPAEPAD